MTGVNSGTPLLAVTDYEEQLWLIQQQDPERILKHIFSWRMNSDVDILKLLNALNNLINEVPELNARYSLSDDGELIKRRAGAWEECVEFVSAESSQSATEYILSRQAAVWDAENDAPFRALIISGEGQIIFTLVLHEIAAPDANLREILRFLRGACAGEAVSGFSLRRPALPPLFAQHAPPVAGLRRASTSLPVACSDARFQRSGEDRALGTRWQAIVDAGALPGPSGAEYPGRDAFAAVVSRFAQFIASLSGRPRQALCLLSEEGPRYLMLDCAKDGARLADAVADRLRVPVDPADPASLEVDAPWVFVRLPASSGPSDEALLWPGEPLLLPTRAAVPDIELALSMLHGRRLALTLTLGQAVYGSLGESLLERLTAFLLGDEGAAAATAALNAGSNGAAASGAGEAESAILSAFRAALNAPDMTPEDDFFDRGGHSLLATRVIGRLLSDHGLEVHFGDFFSYPTAAALAPHAVAVARPGPATPSADGSAGAAPLALAQASLWEAYRAYDFGTLFNLPFALDLLDRVDEALLQAALTDILARHASLRSLFYERAGEPVQRAVEVAQLADYKWFWRSGESQGVTLEDEAAWRFDLARELPVRVRVLDNPDTGRQALSLLVHHMAIDEWSLNLIMEELSQAYAARAAGRAPAWRAPAPAFSEFAVRQRAEGINPQHLAYWQQMLREATRGLALADPQGGAAANASAAGWLEYRPDAGVTQGLYALARQHGASLFSVFYTAIALALHKLGDLRDIAIGTSASGRTDPATYDAVGYFTTMVAHRITFDPDSTVQALMAQVRDTINGSMPYADVPMDRIQQALGIPPEEGLLFDVYIQIHASNALNGSLDGKVRYRQIDPDKTESMFGLQFEIMEDVFDGEKRVRLVTTYRSGRYPEPQVRRITAAIDRLLGFMTAPGALNTPLSQVKA